MRTASKQGRTTKPPPKTRTRLEVDERRTQLIALGLTRFGTQTYDDVSIDDIARAADISKGLLYHYFPTKRAFYIACVREAAGRLLERTDRSGGVDEPLERLTTGLDAYLEYVRAHGRAYAYLLRSGSELDPEIVAIVEATRATFLARLTGGLNNSAVDSALLRIALRGWVGLAETASVAWVEACVVEEAGGPRAPASADVRDLLVRALLAIVGGAAQKAPIPA